MRSKQRVLIVGYKENFHIGYHLASAADVAGIEYHLMDASPANEGLRIIRSLVWRLNHHRPLHLDRFSRDVLTVAGSFEPTHIIVTGITPPNRNIIRLLQEQGIVCLNYSTDDPWNATHSASWFWDVLPSYNAVFTPRLISLEEFKELGIPSFYLPFAYNPLIHYPEMSPEQVRDKFNCDVLFYGGADVDRLPYIEALINSGLKVHLYGGYWARHSITRGYAQGMADTEKLRWAVSKAKITLCLVRRANRDGHVMRTYEAPAMGACMLTEYTPEHEAILGTDGSNVVYFHSINDMVERAHALCKDNELRHRLSTHAYKHITSGKNTYRDRLEEMLGLI